MGSWSVGTHEGAKRAGSTPSTSDVLAVVAAETHPVHVRVRIPLRPTNITEPPIVAAFLL